MGFATIRAAFSPPDQPPPQAAADWMLRDFATAREWAAAIAPCVPFDLGRFDQAAAIIRSTRVPARHLWQVADQLHRDYRTAVQNASCTLGLPTRQDLDAFYLGALFMGFATARASYFYSANATIPPQVVEQITSDFATVRSALPALERCGAPASTIEAQMQAAQRWLGTVPGKDSYTEIAGIYQSIETALKNAKCGSGPAQKTDPAACMQSVCAGACRGAVVLLGVASGSPQCEQCLDQNCRQEDEK